MEKLTLEQEFEFYKDWCKDNQLKASDAKNLVEYCKNFKLEVKQYASR